MATVTSAFPTLSSQQGASLVALLDSLGADADVDFATELLDAHQWDLEATLFAVRGPDCADEPEDEEQHNQNELKEPMRTAASIAMIDLITEVKADESTSVLTKAVRIGGQTTVDALACGPVVRNVVSQGDLGVCGAAAVAGALNACYEGMSEMQRIDWPSILYGHFRDKLGIKVVAQGRDGRMMATTRHVGNGHILRVLRSFPHIGVSELIGKTLAGNPEKAWCVFLEALKQEHMAVLFHSSNHYSLIQGCVGGQEYDESSCAIFTSSQGQEAFELVPFKSALRTITRSHGSTYRMFVVQYTGCKRTTHTKHDIVPSEPLQQDTDAEKPLLELECAICLDVFCEPVQLPCLHTFCRNCIVRISQQKCPLCRTVHPEDFDPVTARLNQPIEELLRRKYVDYAQRVDEAVAERSRMLNLIVGNRHELVANPKRSKNGNHINRHKWTIFVDLQHSILPISDVIERVRFKLAPYYTAWPSTDHHSIRVGKNPEVRSAPFEVTRVGWGFFPVMLVITWKSFLGVPPTEIEHELCFDGNGSCSTHKVDLGHALADAVNPERSRSTGRSNKSVGRATSSTQQSSGQSGNSMRQTQTRRRRT